MQKQISINKVVIEKSNNMDSIESGNKTLWKILSL